LALPPGDNGFVVVLEGGGTVGASSTPVRAGQMAWLNLDDAASVVRLAGGGSGMRAILFAGKPLREPVAARGPFVMNTREELAAGFAEFRTKHERFGL
jgi:redox-sensitive bicupin YhaK (pirin superfamily)